MTAPAGQTDRVLLDTDVFSYLLKGSGESAERYRKYVIGKTVAVSFITIGEIYSGFFKRGVGSARFEAFEAKLHAGLVIIPYNLDICIEYETFLKIRDFGSAHPQEFPDGSAARKAFDTVAAAASKIEAHATAVAQAQAEGKRVKALARAEIANRLALIARTTREASVDDTPDVEPAPTPKLRTDVALLSAARAFINNGQAAMERLVPLGLAPTLLTELQEQVERFEQAARASGHVKALLATERAGIAAAFAAGTRAVERLNVIVTNTFARNPVQLTEWKRVRRVYRKPKASGAPKASAMPTAVAVPTAAPGQPEAGAAPQPGNTPPAVPSDESLKRAS